MPLKQLIFLILLKSVSLELIRDESLAIKLLEKLESEVEPACHNRALKEWNFATNLTEFNQKIAANSSIEYSKFWRRIWDDVIKFNTSGFKNEDVIRQFKLLSTLGISILNDKELREYNSQKHWMESVYSKAKICDYHNSTKCDLSLEPEITTIFKSSRDPEELKYAWIQWRNETGRKVKNNYTEMVKLIKKAAFLNGYEDTSEYELRSYESVEFREEIEEIWLQLKPFYEELHAYVRFKLRNFYGEDIIPHGFSTIPAHILGNPWAQTWENIEEIISPFKTKDPYDMVTKKMNERNMTVIEMAQIAEDFFVSLGFPELSKEFWENSILEKPTDRDIICHASAWDLCNRKDFRIKQCAKINEQDLLTLHHELGHIYYQMSYKTQPKIYRDGPNGGFHEAIGDLISLSVQTPEHLNKIGLLEETDFDSETELNFLLKTALTKIAFLPFGYIMDLWKWNLYEKNETTNMNCDWWKLRVKYQGLSRPGGDSFDENEFDPGAKYHVVSNYPYIRYFVSFILQFQLHESLCDGFKPLHRCDLYGDLEAGTKLRSLLELGSSLHWREALKTVTGNGKMDAAPMLNYYKPLYEFLKMENKRNGEHIGWKEDFECNSGNAKYIQFYVLLSLLLIIAMMVY